MILLGDASDYQQYQINTSCSGWAHKAAQRAPCLLHVLSHYNQQGVPEGLCTNCYLYHPGECPDTPRDFQSLINAVSLLPKEDERYFPMKACKLCQRIHAPTNGVCPTIS